MEQRSLKEKSLEVNRHNPFVQLIGVEIAEVGPDRSLLRLELRPEMLNPHGLVHGGALFTLADNAAGCASSTDGRTYVTQGGDIHFLHTQASGAVWAEALVKHRGRSTVLVEVSLTGEGGRLLATASFTYFCVDGSEIARNSPAAARRS
jgi:acyl-CoA thioesterase